MSYTISRDVTNERNSTNLIALDDRSKRKRARSPMEEETQMHKKRKGFFSSLGDSNRSGGLSRLMAVPRLPRLKETFKYRSL